MIDPILITGCARSGTSMTAGILDISGAWGGTMSGATESNKKGMFENAEIRNCMVKPLLMQVGADPMGQNPLPKEESFRDISGESWSNSILRIIKGQGYDEESLWFYKGAKMCLMWTLWNKAFPNAKWIIVRRRGTDIINSCLKTGFMRAYSGVEGWRSWVGIHVERFQQMKNSGLDIREVYPQEMVDGNFEEIKSVVDWLGLEWKDEKVKEFISPELWHAKKEVK